MARVCTHKSLDDLVGAGEERRLHGEAERFSSLKIDNQLECGRPRDGQIGRRDALEDLPSEDAGLARDAIPSAPSASCALSR